jgi:hypothetical protein
MSLDKFNAFWSTHVEPKFLDDDGFIRELPQYPFTENQLLMNLYFYLTAIEHFEMDKNDLKDRWLNDVSKFIHPIKGRYYKTTYPSDENDFMAHDDYTALLFGSYYFGCFDIIEDANLKGYYHPRDWILYRHLKKLIKGNGCNETLLAVVKLTLKYTMQVTPNPSTMMLWWMRLKCIDPLLPEFREYFDERLKRIYGRYYHEQLLKLAYFNYTIQPINKIRRIVI